MPITGAILRKPAASVVPAWYKAFPVLYTAKP